MIARAILALLGLDGLIIHMHIVLDGGHVLVPQQFLQAKGIVAEHQVADGEGMPEDVRTDAFPRHPRTLADASEEECHPVLGQRQARLGEEQVIFSGAASFGQLFLIGPMLIQVVREVTHAVIAHGNAPLLGAFPGDGEDAMPAVKIADTQPT